MKRPPKKIPANRVLAMPLNNGRTAMIRPFEMAEKCFWPQVKKGGEDECWHFHKLHQSGYGRTCAFGYMMDAHKAAWMIANRQFVPLGKEVLHSCDNGLCCNPKHLSPGTRKQNNQEAWDRKRRSRRGPDCTPQEKAIIADLRSKGYSYPVIGLKIGRPKTTVITVDHKERERNATQEAA